MGKYSKAIVPLVSGIFLTLAAFGLISEEQAETLSPAVATMISTVVLTASAFFAPKNS